jgi:hypothetical protein
MGLTATFGGLRCPACGEMLPYGMMSTMPITEVKCGNCLKEWQIVNHDDGRTEVKPKTVQ